MNSPSVHRKRFTLISMEVISSELIVTVAPFLLSGVMEVINLLVVLSSCSVLGRSSPNKTFPGLRVLEQACLSSWLRKGLIVFLCLKKVLCAHDQSRQQNQSAWE